MDAACSLACHAAEYPAARFAASSSRVTFSFFRAWYAALPMYIFLHPLYIERKAQRPCRAGSFTAVSAALCMPLAALSTYFFGMGLMVSRPERATAAMPEAPLAKTSAALSANRLVYADGAVSSDASGFKSLSAATTCSLSLVARTRRWITPTTSPLRGCDSGSCTVCRCPSANDRMSGIKPCPRTLLLREPRVDAANTRTCTAASMRLSKASRRVNSSQTGRHIHFFSTEGPA